MYVHLYECMTLVPCDIEIFDDDCVCTPIKCICIRLYPDQRKVDSARVDREMAQLRKVTRKKDNQIKSLQSDARRRELILKRRQEEVCVCVQRVLLDWLSSLVVYVCVLCL